MKKVVYILSAVVLALAVWAAMLRLRPLDGHADAVHETRYGVSEGLQLVEQTTAHGDRLYVVEDARGRTLFRIPLRGCLLDTRFRGGRLAFREVATGCEGYVDWQGMVRSPLLLPAPMRVPRQYTTTAWPPSAAARLPVMPPWAARLLRLSLPLSAAAT